MTESSGLDDAMEQRLLEVLGGVEPTGADPVDVQDAWRTRQVLLASRPVRASTPEWDREFNARLEALVGGARGDDPRILPGARTVPDAPHDAAAAADALRRTLTAARTLQEPSAEQNSRFEARLDAFIQSRSRRGTATRRSWVTAALAASFALTIGGALLIEQAPWRERSQEPLLESGYRDGQTTRASVEVGDPGSVVTELAASLRALGMHPTITEQPGATVLAVQIDPDQSAAVDALFAPYRASGATWLPRGDLELTFVERAPSGTGR